MATYFHGNSEIQGSGDGLQTLIFMNPAYVGFSDSHPPPPSATTSSGNIVFLNPNSSGNTLHLPQAPPPQSQHFVGFPFHCATTSADAATQDDVTAALHFQGFLPVPRVHYNPYNNPGMDIEAAREVTCGQKGLSLSLSSSQQQQPSGYESFRLERENDVKVPGGPTSPASGVSTGGHGAQSVILSSKYLKAAQEILDEVVKVGRGAKSTIGESPVGEQPKKMGDSAAAESSEKHGAELSTAERQQLQMKKAKLVNMLDEVEQRYRQYHNQMQMVVSWFEQAAGIGSAKTYTALALQTISRQFRCLKEAILAQIRASSKSLGEEDSFVGKIEGSRLKYVDNQIRQQRALQQLGMFQQNAWRPQRGLPERSVSVLRSWLFEHFLHPYPKDSDKLMLAKQTGLTRSQVSNWFINARVRLWKPMVEEMYMEEVKEQEKNGSDDKSGKTEHNKVSTSKFSTAPQAKGPAIPNQNQDSTSKTDNPINHTAATSLATSTALVSPPGFKSNPSFLLIGSSSEMGTITQGTPKKPRNGDMLHAIGTLMGARTNFSDGFASYQLGEHGAFGDNHVQTPFPGNGVSLTLGLPHSHQNFMPQSIQLERGVEIGEPNDFSSMNSTPNSYTLNHCV